MPTRAKIRPRTDGNPPPPPPPPPPSADVTVRVDRTTPSGVSNWMSGVDLIQDTFRGSGTPLANAVAEMGATCRIANQHFDQFGAPDAWPVQSETYAQMVSNGRFAYVNARVTDMENAGVATMVTCALCPQWMKKDPANTESAPDPTHYDDFAECCRRYALYFGNRVTWWQIWNEMKGFWNGSLNRWDYESYVTLYNKCYTAIKSVSPNAKVGGPYSPIHAARNSDAYGSKDATLKGGSNQWETVDQRDVDVVSYFIGNAVGYDFVCNDGGWNTRTVGTIGDKMLNSAYFGAVTRWIRAQTTKPTVWSEFYPGPDTMHGTSDLYPEAHCRYAAQMYHLITSGGSASLIWRPEDAPNEYTSSVPFPANRIWKNTQLTAANGGGTERPDGVGPALRIMLTFGPGTTYYTGVSSDPKVLALADATSTVIINGTASSKTVAVNDAVFTLAAFEVRKVSV